MANKNANAKYTVKIGDDIYTMYWLTNSDQVLISGEGNTTLSNKLTTIQGDVSGAIKKDFSNVSDALAIELEHNDYLLIKRDGQQNVEKLPLDAILGYTIVNTPIASKSNRGVVKIGDGLSVTEDGTVSANIQEVSDASPSQKGVLKLYDAIGQGVDGTITQKLFSDNINTIITNIENMMSPIDYLASANIVINEGETDVNGLIYATLSAVLGLSFVAPEQGDAALLYNESTTPYMYPIPNADAYLNTAGSWLWIYNGTNWQPAIKFPTPALVSGTADGLMRKEDFTKLQGIVTGATKVENSGTNGNIKINDTEQTIYTHPTTAGNKHVPTGGSTGQFLRYAGSSGTAEWINFAAAVLTGFTLGSNTGNITSSDTLTIALSKLHNTINTKQSKIQYSTSDAAVPANDGDVMIIYKA